MERRLQLLLDQARYDRVADQAARTGRSVAAMIRDAIDAAYPSGEAARSLALTEFLASSAKADGPTESWDQISAELDDRLDDELTR